MSKEMTVIALGVWAVIIPYLGVPGSWRTVLLLLTGAAIVIVGFLLRAEALSRGISRSSHHPFADNDSHATPHRFHANDRSDGLSSLN